VNRFRWLGGTRRRAPQGMPSRTPGATARRSDADGAAPETRDVTATPADPVLALLVRNVPGSLYDLMVTVGPAADDIIAGSRRRLLALIRARDADGAGQEMEQHVEGLSWMVERRCVSVQEATLWTANKIAMVDLDVVVGAGAVGCPLDE